MFIINENEMSAIYQALVEAKFSPCLKKKEIRGSSHVARIVTGLHKDIMSSYKLSSTVSQEISDFPEYLDIIITDLKQFNIQRWSELGEDQSLYVKNLCSPFSVSEELLEQLLSLPGTQPEFK